MNTNIEHISYVKITSGESECIIAADVWDQVVDVLDVVAEYTRCKDVRKVAAIKLVCNHVEIGLREAKIAVEAYFEPRFVPYEGQEGYIENQDRGWHKYN